MIDPANIRAVILDFDGLLVDTTAYSYEAWRDIYATYGVTLDEDIYAELMHEPSEYMLDYLEDVSNICIPDPETRERLLKTRRDYIDINVKARGIKPGVSALLLSCEKAGIPVAVASNTPDRILFRRLQSIGIHYDRVHAIVGTTSSRAPKPAPDILLAASDILRIAPEHCLAVDNSPHDIDAAEAAGIPAALIPDTITRHIPADGIDTLSSLYALAALIDERPTSETTEPGSSLPNPFDDTPQERPPGTLPPPPKRLKRRIV